MRQDEGLATALFALVIGGAVALAIASDITAPLCEASKIKSAAPDKIEFGCLEFWLNRYQTMIAALLALGAAGASVHFLRKQIGQTDRHEEERYARESAGARALLPISLQEICSYANDVALMIQRHWPHRNSSTLGDTLRIEAPALPVEALDRLEKVIRSAPADQGQALSKIAIRIQILDARLKGGSASRFVGEHNLTEYALDAVEVFGRCEANFSFARGEGSSSILLSQANAQTACKLMDVRAIEPTLVKAVVARPLRFPA